jgi:ribonuclease P protein component
MAPPETLPRAERLRRTNDFQRVERQGARGQGRFVTAIARTNHRGPRVGFTVSKKVGNAVVRNLVKRRLRDIARRHKDLWRAHDVVVVAKPEAAAAAYRELESDVLAAMSAALSAGGRRGAPQAKK